MMNVSAICIAMQIIRWPKMSSSLQISIYSETPLKTLIEEVVTLIKYKNILKGKCGNTMVQFCIKIDIHFARILFYINSALICFNHQTTF